MYLCWSGTVRWQHPAMFSYFTFVMCDDIILLVCVIVSFDQKSDYNVFFLK